MLNAETCIIKQMVLVSSGEVQAYDHDLLKACKYKRYTLCITPVSVEKLKSTIIYKVKDNAVLHRMNKRKLSWAFISRLRRDPNNYIMNETADTLDYFTANDVEPYVLSDYDESRLAKDKDKDKIDKTKLFKSFILPQIKAITDSKDVKDYYVFDETTLTFKTLKYNVSYSPDDRLFNVQYLIYETLKSIEVTSRRKYNGNVEILLTETLNKLFPDQKV